MRMKETDQWEWKKENDENEGNKTNGQPLATEIEWMKMALKLQVLMKNDQHISLWPSYKYGIIATTYKGTSALFREGGWASGKKFAEGNWNFLSGRDQGTRKGDQGTRKICSIIIVTREIFGRDQGMGTKYQMKIHFFYISTRFFELKLGVLNISWHASLKCS